MTAKRGGKKKKTPARGGDLQHSHGHTVCALACMCVCARVYTSDIDAHSRLQQAKGSCYVDAADNGCSQVRESVNIQSEHNYSQMCAGMWIAGF